MKNDNSATRFFNYAEERMNARISVSNRSFSLNNTHYVGACFEIKL